MIGEALSEAGRYLTPRGGQDARQVRLRAKLEKADVPRKKRPDTGVTVHLSVHLHQHEHTMTEDYGDKSGMLQPQQQQRGHVHSLRLSQLPRHDPVWHGTF